MPFTGTMSADQNYLSQKLSDSASNFHVSVWSVDQLQDSLYSVPHESFQALPLRLDKGINLTGGRLVAVGVILIRAMSDIEYSGQHSSTPGL